MKKHLAFLLAAVLLLSLLLMIPANSFAQTHSRPPKPWKTYACSEGPLFLSYNPALTDYKLMFTPIDLAVDGEYSFPLIAAGSREIGQVQAKVENGLITVHLAPYKGVKLTQESSYFPPVGVYPAPLKRSTAQPMLFFFPDIASVKSVKPQNIQHLRLPFDQPVDVVQSLSFSDTKVLMYVYALVTMEPGAQVKPFSLTDPGYLERVEALKLLMD